MGWFLQIKDKVEVKSKLGEKLCCPAHCWPHKFPFTKPIIDEPCHYHNAKWRMAHHVPFCFLIRCPNYKRMREKCEEDK